MKKILIILWTTIWVLILWLFLAFYTSKMTNKPCNHVEPDCEVFCNTHDDYQCGLCHPYDYCWPEALLDRINFLHI